MCMQTNFGGKLIDGKMEDKRNVKQSQRKIRK